MSKNKYPSGEQLAAMLPEERLEAVERCLQQIGDARAVIWRKQVENFSKQITQFDPDFQCESLYVLPPPNANADEINHALKQTKDNFEDMCNTLRNGQRTGAFLDRLGAAAKGSGCIMQ